MPTVCPTTPSRWWAPIRTRRTPTPTACRMRPRRRSAPNPTVADSDVDGVTDGLEVSSGSDPLGPSGGPFDHDPHAGVDLAGRRAGQGRRRAAGAQQAAQQAAAAQQTTATQQAPAERPGRRRPVDRGPTRPAEDKLSIFLSSAKDQIGDRYVYGAPRTPTAADPKTFDCSSFTQWSARQAGVKLEGTAEYQYMELKRMNHDIPVEQALRTKGALLFYFSSEPSGGLPAGQAHVAISLGDGRTVEAKGTKYGVGEWSAKHRFNFAATVPGISDESGLKAHREATSAGPASMTRAPARPRPVVTRQGPEPGSTDRPAPSTVPTRRRPTDGVGRTPTAAPRPRRQSAVNGLLPVNGTAPVNGSRAGQRHRSGERHRR